MYPNDNRYPENIPPLDSMNQPIYNNQIRTPSMDINNRPTLYYDPSFYDKNPMMQPVYDYINPPNINQPASMMPMNQVIDPRYSNWRQSSQNRPSMIHSYYQRPPAPINQGYMHSHSKPQMGGMIYSDNYPNDHMMNMRTPQLNVLQRISLLIKPQLPQLRRIMSKVSTASNKKKQTSKRQKSRQRQRQRQRSHDRQHRKESSGGQWVCSKCSFLNFDWRQKCKKCNQIKPIFPPGKNYNPGPEDWKCTKCGNLNYARRLQCNRCRQSRNNFSNNR